MIQKERKATKKRQIAFESFRDGRDEMNLVEFPIATLSERNNGKNILEYQRETYDRVLGKPVVRKLTVTGDVKHGLPTAKDEEVYLGLLQLTKITNDFKEPKVLFTRSQLIKLMGWKNRDWSYHRVAKAFCRLTGVRLFYENAWRDNSKKRYCSQGGFGLLDSFQLRDGRIRSPGGDETDRLSEFRWNSVVFDSFQSGYLKKIDYSKARELSVVARRMYRYLDKHFYPPKKTTLVLNLKTFAFEHIGLSRRYDSAQIRRALDKPIRELEITGFLQPAKQRFRKLSGQRGEWEATFTLVGHRPKRSTSKQKPQTVGKRPARSSKPDEIDRYMLTLTRGDLQSIEKQAMATASGFLLDTIENASNGPLAEECRKQIVKSYLRQRLSGGKKS